ncbi:hypothetical protein B0H15DRAFT_1024558, partial [Mycena belliarum]
MPRGSRRGLKRRPARQDIGRVISVIVCPRTSTLAGAAVRRRVPPSPRAPVTAALVLRPSASNAMRHIHLHGNASSSRPSARASSS